MDPEDKSLDDCDGPIACFRGATLQIQEENPVEDVASLSISVSQTSQSGQNWTSTVVNREDPREDQISETKSGRVSLSLSRLVLFTVYWCSALHHNNI